MRGDKEKLQYIARAALEIPLDQHLREYKGFSSKVKLDNLWVQFDEDKNGLLDRKEAKKFLNKIKTLIVPERQKNYSEEKFE